MAPNVSVITIRWLLTVETEIAFFLFHSLAEGVLFSFKTHAVQEKLIFQSKLNSENRYRTHRSCDIGF